MTTTIEKYSSIFDVDEYSKTTVSTPIPGHSSSPELGARWGQQEC